MSLKRREELIAKVVKYEGDPSNYFVELRSFGWDCDQNLVTLTKEDIQHVLDKFLSGSINESHVTEWANFIERREDIELEQDQKAILDEVIFWLANPKINYGINKQLIVRIEEAFKNGI